MNKLINKLYPHLRIHILEGTFGYAIGFVSLDDRLWYHQPWGYAVRFK